MTENPFVALNDYFDHVYVITLRRAVERQEKITQHLQGLNFSFFYGADKNDFSIDELKEKEIYNEEGAQNTHRYNKAMTGGQIGCSWSHRLVYEDILQKGFEKVLILEDDVKAAPGIALFNTVMRQLPPDWDLVYFDYHKNISSNIGTRIKQQVYRIQRKMGGLKWSDEMIGNLHATGYSAHLKKAGYHMYTSAYALRREAAAKLVGMQTPIVYIADDLLAHAITNNVINGFISLPRLFTQESQADKSSGSYVEN
ncbi:MAG: hypothetical protein K0Q66_166 [Chitinophagaceae bacterium]|jgi:glycosyl transferase family 25|nr:hypothetical protein [Chitinophagaceae bacterium]